MTSRDRVIELLESIDRSLKALLKQQPPTASNAGAVASAADLDGKYGNPTVRSMPKRWNGAPYKGRKFSECPPELLDLVAESLEWQAGKADEKDERTPAGKPVSKYRRDDAARARGWAQRMRQGLAPAPVSDRSPATPATARTVPNGWDDVDAADVDPMEAMAAASPWAAATPWAD